MAFRSNMEPGGIDCRLDRPFAGSDPGIGAHDCRRYPDNHDCRCNHRHPFDTFRIDAGDTRSVVIDELIYSGTGKTKLSCQ